MGWMDNRRNDLIEAPTSDPMDDLLRKTAGLNFQIPPAKRRPLPGEPDAAMNAALAEAAQPAATGPSRIGSILKFPSSPAASPTQGPADPGSLAAIIGGGIGAAGLKPKASEPVGPPTLAFSTPVAADPIVNFMSAESANALNPQLAGQLSSVPVGQRSDLLRKYQQADQGVVDQSFAKGKEQTGQNVRDLDFYLSQIVGPNRSGAFLGGASPEERALAMQSQRGDVANLLADQKRQSDLKAHKDLVQMQIDSNERIHAGDKDKEKFKEQDVVRREAAAAGRNAENNALKAGDPPARAKQAGLQEEKDYVDKFITNPTTQPDPKDAINGLNQLGAAFNPPEAAGGKPEFDPTKIGTIYAQAATAKEKSNLITQFKKSPNYEALKHQAYDLLGRSIGRSDVSGWTKGSVGGWTMEPSPEEKNQSALGLGKNLFMSPRQTLIGKSILKGPEGVGPEGIGRIQRQMDRDLIPSVNPGEHRKKAEELSAFITALEQSGR